MKINVTMKVKNMYEFMMRHAYISVLGVGSLLFSILSFVYLCVNFSQLTGGTKVLMIIASLLFTVINPIWIYVNSAKQVKLNPMFKEELTYIFDEKGIRVVQNEQEAQVEWAEINKIVETGMSVIIYLSKVRAFVIPKESIEKETKQFFELIESSVDAKVCRLKKA